MAKEDERVKIIRIGNGLKGWLVGERVGTKDKGEAGLT